MSIREIREEPEIYGCSDGVYKILTAIGILYGVGVFQDLIFAIGSDFTNDPSSPSFEGMLFIYAFAIQTFFILLCCIMYLRINKTLVNIILLISIIISLAANASLFIYANKKNWLITYDEYITHDYTKKHKEKIHIIEKFKKKQ